MTTTDPHGTRIEGFVTFRLDRQVYAARLAEVREIIRLERLAALPGMCPPLAGVVDLRGVPLPVYDVRPPGAHPGGDVLVLESASAADPVGIVVDRVLAVDPVDLRPGSGRAPLEALPEYVLDVMHTAEGQVFLVHLRGLVAGSAPHRPSAAGGYT